MVTFGRRIKELRLKARLSQQELADQVGIEQTLISRIERGARSVSVDELPLFAKALGVTVIELVSESEVETGEAVTNPA